ncbi:hypothetical protein GCM10027271_01540 [Saccharopolyspora gloriosae]|uniref:Uncharacterized protein n=1 Tax=Saccharopolyspora gloriosae TaxID=455344 RepID=A0A840NMS5_9PSEU|nr:hypothetical protein [Saccharopolyspora gloriosae]MBB5070579.1 hypothetical protein [Saccharopolyspora gloriosae]
MTTRDYGLPCAWHYDHRRGITLRWGRPDGFFTVHGGDQRGKRGDHALLDTVRVTQAWQDELDVAHKAREWARANPPRKATTGEHR